MPYTPLTQDQFKAAQKAGFTTDQIISMEQKRKSEIDQQESKPKKKSLVSDIKDTLGEATSYAHEINTATKEGKQGQASRFLQLAGASSKAIGDVAFKTAKHGVLSLIPDKYEENFKQNIKEVGAEALQTPIISKSVELAGIGIDKYEKWKEKNPVAARNLEATVNIAALFPGAKITGEATSVAKGAAKELADVASSAGKKKLLSSVERSVDSLEAKYVELFTGQSPTKQKKFKIAQDVTEIKNLAGTQGIPPQRVLAEAGVIPKQDGARLSTLTQAEEFRNRANSLQELNQKVLQEAELHVPRTNLRDVEVKAIQKVRDSNNTSSAKDQMIAKIQQEFSSARSEYGNEVPLTVMDKIKSSQWKATKFDSTVPQIDRDVHYAIGNAYKEAIESSAKAAGADDVAQLNRNIGDIQEAAKFLEGLNGKTVKGGRTLNISSRIIGATIGAQSGVLAAIIGGAAGDATASLLISNYVAGPVKRLLLRQIKQENPIAYEKAAKWLADKKIYRDELLQLPAAGASGAPVIPPSPTTYESPAKKSTQTLQGQQKLLPPPSGGATGVPIYLPQSARETNLGLDELRRIKR